MDVRQRSERFSVTGVLTSLLQEFSAVPNFSTLRDNLPARLVQLLACQGALIYLAIDETLQLASATFDDQPGWSASLLAVAHINPILASSQVPEARAWQEKRTVGAPGAEPTLVAVPLISRLHCIGVLVVVRGRESEAVAVSDLPVCWSFSEIEPLETIAGVVALLLENTRLRDRDRERIHELSLLNSISSQLHSSLYEKERLYSIVVQRTKEISAVDICALLEPSPVDLDEEWGVVPAEGNAWLTPALHDFLFRWCCEQQSFTPLIVERTGAGDDPRIAVCLELLPARVKTFFVIPLLSGDASERSMCNLPGASGQGGESSFSLNVLGIIVGGYYQARKVRRAELTLLQVLASQVSAAMENIRLMAEVIEARNEARDLLRQVLDDRRVKELILESIPSGLITTDLQGRIQTFNRAAATILGYHPYEVLGQSLRKFLDVPPSCLVPLTPVLPVEGVERADGGREIGAFRRARLVVPDRFERKRVLEVDALPLYDEQGGRVGMLVTFSDMTAMQHLEEEKLRLDRLAALGEMAAGVAHEVRNPLASIKTTIQMLRDDLLHYPENESQKISSENLPSLPTLLPALLPPLVDKEGVGFDHDWVEESTAVVLKEVERLDCIVRDLLLFARPRQLHRVRCDLVELSDQVLALLQKQLTDANVLVHRVYEDLLPAWLDMGQIEQVLLNLLTNAIQAMPDGGIVTVTCRGIPGNRLPNPLAMHGPGMYSNSSTPVSSPTKSQQWLELIVSDTGTGIASIQQERIFQPFYTTKAHGIGLGLSITRRLVEDHGGLIAVESQLGYGTAVRVYLPIVSKEEVYG
jgi:PAS domain S-box-containing protein